VKEGETQWSSPIHVVRSHSTDSLSDLAGNMRRLHRRKIFDDQQQILGNMAEVIISEVQCFITKIFKRIDKTTMTEITSKFYHEDELYSAKVELNNHVTSQSNVSIEGWSKVVNKQGQPVIAESENVLYMLAAIDVHKVDLQKFVAADLDRIPVVAGLSR